MNANSLFRHVGEIVLLIYMDRQGRISERRVRVDSVSDGVLKGYCLLRRGPRVFQLEGVLACLPDGRGRRSFG